MTFIRTENIGLGTILIHRQVLSLIFILRNHGPLDEKQCLFHHNFDANLNNCQFGDQC